MNGNISAILYDSSTPDYIRTVPTAQESSLKGSLWVESLMPPHLARKQCGLLAERNDVTQAKVRNEWRPHTCFHGDPRAKTFTSSQLPLTPLRWQPFVCLWIAEMWSKMPFYVVFRNPSATPQGANKMIRDPGQRIQNLNFLVQQIKTYYLVSFG